MAGQYHEIEVNSSRQQVNEQFEWTKWTATTQPAGSPPFLERVMIRSIPSYALHVWEGSAWVWNMQDTSQIKPATDNSVKYRIHTMWKVIELSSMKEIQININASIELHYVAIIVTVWGIC